MTVSVNAVTVPGVWVWEGSVVVAGAVVEGDVPVGVVVMGNPHGSCSASRPCPNGLALSGKPMSDESWERRKRWIPSPVD